MPKLTSLGQRRPITVYYEDTPIEVVFRPATITDEWIERLTSLEKNDRAGYQTLLAEALIEWNITDDDDRPLPTSVETMRELPVDLLYQISWDIFDELSPKQRSGGRSAAG